MTVNASPIGKGYALWLMPDEPMYSHLARKISRLSQQLSTPRFEPHITLLGRIIMPEGKVVERSRRLACCLRPFRIELADIDHLDEFFRCVFVTVRPGRAILQARQGACRVLAHRWEPYMPHASLVYGKLPADRRKEIARGPSLLPRHATVVHKLALYLVNGPVHQWKCIETFDLK